MFSDTIIKIYIYNWVWTNLLYRYLEHWKYF